MRHLKIPPGLGLYLAPPFHTEGAKRLPISLWEQNVNRSFMQILFPLGLLKVSASQKSQLFSNA
jgi:hypothetical protein